MLVQQSVTHQGPMYIRLGKAGEQVFHTAPIADYQLGDLLPIVEAQSPTLVLTSGSILGRVMESRREKGLSVDVYTVPVVKPLNARQLCELSMRYDQLIIVEENQKSGGIGSALIEVLSDSYNHGLLPRYPKVSRVAIDDIYLQITGSQRYLQEAAGLVL